ncbi:MAG TPA: D-alanyl-D-alanine carboxypeptidase/D-alanyl-D-alanine-endopeptidase, partial [Pseudohongiella sp.]|nr:D-alanyl-D-alanine carboxypeptidase/D-alanyl-D-alanine-endopeptidase [Pseudohongiella sp.]
SIYQFGRRALIGTALLCSLFLPVTHAQQTVPAPVQFVINGYKFPQNSYSLYVREVGQQEPLLAVNQNLPLNPASTMKTLTTLAGLELLGPVYQWQTRVYALGEISEGTLNGDLLIQGGGDPFLVEENLRALLKNLQRRGVQRITGDLVVDASLYDPAVSQEALIDNDTRRAYNVLPHAMMVNFQTVNFYFEPHSNGRDVVIQADPALPNLRIRNQLKLQHGACTGFQRGIRFDINEAGDVVTFSGNFPSRCEQYSMTRSVLDAPNYAYGMFSLLWKELGGDFSGKLRVQTLPDATLQPLLVHRSPVLADVIKSINKYSNNMMTRHLLLQIGLEKYGAPATVANGVQAVHEYLSALGIDHSSLVLVNGAGLSREARLTTEMLAAVLEHGWSISTMPEFLASLPLSGMDGTLRTRLQSEGPRGSMHVKTGSLDNVAGVAGYVHARSGKHYIVVALVNHNGVDNGPGQELSDALLTWVWNQ